MGCVRYFDVIIVIYISILFLKKLIVLILYEYIHVLSFQHAIGVLLKELLP